MDQSDIRVDKDENFRIENTGTESEVYTFVSSHSVSGSKAIATAKKQFSVDHGVDTTDLVARKVGSTRNDYGGPVILVAHRPIEAAEEVSGLQ